LLIENSLERRVLKMYQKIPRASDVQTDYVKRQSRITRASPPFSKSYAIY